MTATAVMATVVKITTASWRCQVWSACVTCKTLLGCFNELREDRSTEVVVWGVGESEIPGWRSAPSVLVEHGA